MTEGVEWLTRKVGMHSYKDGPPGSGAWQNRVCFTCFMTPGDHETYDRLEARAVTDAKKD